MCVAEHVTACMHHDSGKKQDWEDHVGLRWVM